MRHAEETGDLLAWIDAALAHYVRAQENGATLAELEDLRGELVARADSLRSQTRSRVGRLWASEVIDATLGEPLQDVVAQGADASPDETFRLAEAARARTLLDSIASGFREPPDDEEAGRLRGLERELLQFGDDRQDGLVFSEMRLASALTLGARAHSDQARPRERLREVEELTASLAAGFDAVAPCPPLERVMKALEPGELLLEYVIPFHPLHPAIAASVVAVTREEARVVPTGIAELPNPGIIGRLTVDDLAPIDTSPLGNAVVSIRAAVQQGEDAEIEPHLRTLYDLLVGPLVAAGVEPRDFKRVILVPHRLLHPLPWAALVGPSGSPLVEDVALAFAPSAAVWLALAERRAPFSPSCLALVNPVLAYAGLEALPDAEQEVETVTAELGQQGVECEVLPGLGANETALRANAVGKGIVYLATHGAFPENDALDFHRVLLSRTRRDPGPVSAESVRRLDLRAAWLAVLSICDGGLYRFGPGDEPFGLVPALLTAGAENVIGTLWEIDDRAGRALMTAASPHLLSAGPAEALRRAASQFVDDSDVPVRDWAGFVAIGTGRPAR